MDRAVHLYKENKMAESFCGVWINGDTVSGHKSKKKTTCKRCLKSEAFKPAPTKQPSED